MSTPTSKSGDASSNASIQSPYVKRGRSKDIGWKYGTSVDPHNRDSLTCNFCQKVCKGEIYRLKQHLAGTSTNVTACYKVPVDVKVEILEYMQKTKQARNEKIQMVSEAESRDDLLKDFTSKDSSMEVSQANPLDDILAKPPRMKGPMDKFCTLDPEQTTRKTTKDKKWEKERRERVNQCICRWIYQDGIPFNAVRLPSFQTMLEAIGQYGPGLKCPSYHELRETLLQKEIQKDWSTFEQVHTKKRNRLEQKRLNDFIFVQYNQHLHARHLRFQQSDHVSVSLEDIDDCNEWIAHPPEKEDFVDEGEYLTWLDGEIDVGVNEEEGPSTRAPTKTRRQGKGKNIVTSHFIDEVDVDSEETSPSENELPSDRDYDSFTSDEEA